MIAVRTLIFFIQALLLATVFVANTFIEVVNYRALANGNYVILVLLVILEAIYIVIEYCITKSKKSPKSNSLAEHYPPY